MIIQYYHHYQIRDTAQLVFCYYNETFNNKLRLLAQFLRDAETIQYKE